MTRIGYGGRGLMVSAMARNLIKAGFPRVVQNRSRAFLDKWVGEGATAATSPKEVAQQVDVVLTNLPDSPDVEKVVLGPNGIIEGAHTGLTYIDNSTIKPETARKDRKSTRLNSSHQIISYAVFCLKKKKKTKQNDYLVYS